MADVGKKPSKALFFDGTYDLDHFHEVFIEKMDPTEYTAAMELVGDWIEWNRLKAQWSEFNDLVEVWKEEVRVKMDSEALANLYKMSKGNGPNGLTASKFIATREYDKKRTAGRPSKAEVQRRAAISQRVDETIQSQKRRVLEMIQGGKASNGEE